MVRMLLRNHTCNVYTSFSTAASDTTALSTLKQPITNGSMLVQQWWIMCEDSHLSYLDVGSEPKLSKLLG